MDFTLKVPTKEDRQGIIDVCNSVDRTYLSERMPDPYTEASADWWINMIKENDGKTGIWRLICIDGRDVGHISVEKKEDVYRKDSEIGYLLRTEYWSKGIMTEAVKRICMIAFEELDIERITGLYYEPNVASGRVLEKAGFEYEGLMKKAVFKNNELYNLCVTGLLKENMQKH